MRKSAVLFILFFCCHFYMSAQENQFFLYKNEVERSVKKVAKYFDVKSKSLTKANSNLSKKISEGQVIRIPLNDKTYVYVNRLFNTHIVLPKETVFGLTKQYDITKEYLFLCNPELETMGLKMGMKLIIPKIEKPKVEESDAFEYYTISKGDTYFNLFKRFGFEMDTLKNFNSELQQGLKLGMRIRYPKKNENNHEVTDSLKIEGTENLTDITYVNDQEIKKHFLEIAFWLPFKFHKIDTLSKENLFSSKTNLNNIISDFYLGAEMAIDSIKKKGVDVFVRVFDTANNKDTIQSVIAKNDFSTVDVMFGPVYNKNTEFISGLLSDHLFVFPFFSSKQSNFTHQNVIKTATDREVLVNALADEIVENYHGQNIVLVGDDKKVNRAHINSFIELVKAKDSTIQFQYILPENSYISNNRFKEVSDTLSENTYVLLSNDLVVISDIINNMKMLSVQDSLEVMSIGNLKKFELIESALLSRYKTKLISRDYIDAKRSNLNQFIDSYLKKNFNYPSEYALRGFDVVYDALIRIATKGNVSDAFNHEVYEGLQGSFQYHTKQDSILSKANQSYFIINYNKDLSLTVKEGRL